MIEEAVRKKLLASQDLRNLVGDRIYVLKLPQNPTYPAVTFFKASNPRHHDLDIAYPRFQFDVWAASYEAAKNVADEIRKALQREKGDWSGIKVIQGVYLNEIDLYEDDTKIYHIVSDYKIIYKGE